MQRLANHREQPIPNFTAHRDDVPVWVTNLFQTLVAKEPGDRPQTMVEVVERIDAGDQQVPVSDPISESERTASAWVIAAGLMTATALGVGAWLLFG